MKSSVCSGAIPFSPVPHIVFRDAAFTWAGGFATVIGTRIGACVWFSGEKPAGRASTRTIIWWWTRPIGRLRNDLLHYSNPNISSYVSKINYFADLHLQHQLAVGARWSAPEAVFRAGWRFVRAYFLRRGFLDGYPGFFIAASTAYSTLVRHSRLFEHGQPAKPLCAPAKSP